MTGRFTTILLTLLMAGGCSTIGGSLAELGADEAHLPKQFSMYIGGFGGPYFNVGLRNGRLHYGATYADKAKNIELEIAPTPAAWEGFWRKLEDIGIWSWQHEYLNPGVVDGTQWSVQIQYRDRLLNSRGDNNYPLAEGRTDNPEPTADFELFLAAVRELLGGLEFY